MSGVVQARCANHPQREAAARCTGCGGYFCRECIIEHHDRMLCAGCLRPAAGRDAKGRLRAAAATSLRLATGLAILWITFYNLGRLLIFFRSRHYLGTLLGPPFTE